MEKSVVLNRRINQVHIWEGNNLVASYWNVVGLAKNDKDNRWSVRAKCNNKKRTVGSISMENAHIEERWQ